MSDFIISVENISEKDNIDVGGKAYSMAIIHKNGFKVPAFFCVKVNAYSNYLIESGLEGKILLELARKDFSKMRWEEMWDTSLRLKNLFLSENIPKYIEDEIRAEIAGKYTEKSLVIRSSAPGEDSDTTSFAGIHESYVNVIRIQDILESIKLVWASLWSDAAILYREELNLDIKNSTMAVIIQELVEGDKSGIIFTKDPTNEEQMVLESVYGLNEGLVSGDIEPDRWILDRKTGVILQHTAPSTRIKNIILKEIGTTINELEATYSKNEPLSNNDIKKLYEVSISLENIFSCPQDIEWTMKDGELFLLQSRPITTLKDNEKQWYLSLKRTFENLKKLRLKIENTLIPEMIEDAKSIKEEHLENLNDSEISDLIDYRRKVFLKWESIYRKDFIPFAHGMRLFGDVYNKKIKPSDPYEFMHLLVNSNLLSIQRNRQLTKLATMVKEDKDLRKNIEKRILEGNFEKELDKFVELFGKSSYVQDKNQLLKLIIELSEKKKNETKNSDDSKSMEITFFSKFELQEQEYASELLDLGRASYRLRDDDNIYLGTIEGHYLNSLEEGKKRLVKRSIQKNISPDEIIKALKQKDYVPKVEEVSQVPNFSRESVVRQLQGQPASQGLATGEARVIEQKDDLFYVKAGDILVCDAVEPNMTFVVPLVAGIVERRGGMLIHGAIIAREYGIPCVTGIPDATNIINNGDEVTVDGYLGIVVIEKIE
ncbi:PEP/pyruvate-binding domain-containing protein [Methanolobus bombayensis]|uniref:PEP/pyruvate-binding domain-containing protein n=1 Tax=Methanolobus bombayensis TaxID=38023 RepID=UPI001AE230ED|nr:PEP/pyruvate-binding domain-containing protein [Methanolobus bombayensis]MBP1910202.1 pyruvate,water dikinase [Methanolobus bombayensis]